MSGELVDLHRMLEIFIPDRGQREIAREAVDTLERYLRDHLPEEKAAAWDREGGHWDRAGQCVTFPEEMEGVLRELGEMGVFGLTVPEEHGGGGLPAVAAAAAVELLSRRSPSLAVTVSIHHTAMDVIGRFGTAEQRTRFLPRMASGEWLGGVAYTEAQSGSDMGAARTVARAEGEVYLLTGEKVFVTSGGRAQVLILLALTDPALGKKGLSTLIFTRDDPGGNRRKGFTVAKLEEKIGIRASITATIALDACPIPRADLLGTPGRGLAQALWGMDGGRIGIGAQALGLAESAYWRALEHIKVRQQFGQPLAHFQGIQFQVAEMRARLAAARLAVYHAAWCRDHMESCTEEAALAKKLASEGAEYIANMALELLGGYGYTEEYRMGRWVADAKITKIYEGTNNIQNLVIARSALEK